MRGVVAMCVAGVLAGCGGDAPADGSVAAVTAASASGNGTRCVLNTRLSPGNEVRTPANETDPTVESTATGHAQVKVREDGTLELKVFVLNLGGEEFTAGHIHRGPPDANGPVVVPLFSGATAEEHLVQHGVVEVPGAFDVLELCEDPGAFYVNYHTTQDPVGATRGQLDR